jgi:hypothetical protein
LQRNVDSLASADASPAPFLGTDQLISIGASSAPCLVQPLSRQPRSASIATWHSIHCGVSVQGCYHETDPSFRLARRLRHVVLNHRAGNFEAQASPLGIRSTASSRSRAAITTLIPDCDWRVVCAMSCSSTEPMPSKRDRRQVHSAHFDLPRESQPVRRDGPGWQRHALSRIRRSHLPVQGSNQSAVPHFSCRAVCAGLLEPLSRHGRSATDVKRIRFTSVSRSRVAITTPIPHSDWRIVRAMSCSMTEPIRSKGNHRQLHPIHCAVLVCDRNQDLDS